MVVTEQGPGAISGPEAEEVASRPKNSGDVKRSKEAILLDENEAAGGEAEGDGGLTE